MVRNAIRPGIWLTWENQRRNRELAASLDVELYAFTDLMDVPRWKKYVLGSYRTILTIAEARPGIIFCQNPSIVLAALAVVIGKATGIPVVVDNHHTGVFPGGFLDRVAGFVHRHATLSIVTNPSHARVIESRGGRAFVLQDRIPALTFSGVPLPAMRTGNAVLVVSSWAADEPLANIIRAARSLDSKDVRFYFTGKPPRHFGDDETIPQNVHLLGFLSEQAFVDALFSADAVLDLTTSEDCLVCGAYEGIAAGRPLVLSDTSATKAYFTQGVVYCDNSAAGIAAAVIEALANRCELATSVEAFRNTALLAWQVALRDLQTTVHSFRPPA
jgi:glycosyltransferase involved in cell wall biosynthesis